MRKKIMKATAWSTMLMLAMCLVLAGCKDSKKSQRENWTDEETAEAEDEEDEEAPDTQKTVDVRDARDFILALENNTQIDLVTNDPLHLTPAIDELVDEGRLERFYVNGTPRGDAGVFYEPEYDGNTLIVSGLHNIVIKGTHQNKGFLIVEPRYAEVIRFYNCKELLIDNVIMGHSDAGDCSGDVLALQKCKNVAVSNCELFGCGVNGLSADHSSDITVTNCQMYGCSDYGVTIRDSKNMSFKDCEIFNNYGGILADEYCEDVVFNKCKLHDNKGQLFFCYSDIELRNCDVEHHHDDDTSHVIMNNCRVQMDYAEAEELPDVEPEM